MGVFVCCLCAQPTIAMGSAHKPIKNWYLFAIFWLASWMQVPLAFKAACFGGHPSSGSLQTWGTICWVEALHSSGRNWELTSLLIVCHCIRGGVYDKLGADMSQLFLLILMWLFSHLPNV